MKRSRIVPLFFVFFFFVHASATAAGEKVTVTEALAAALLDGGTRVATNVPATGVTEVFDVFHKMAGRQAIYSYNEEAAYTVAHGAALGGARSAAILKSHGFAKAANSVIDSITAGTCAGFLVLVFHDQTGEHSDNVFDTLAFVEGTKIPLIRPKPEECYADVLRAFKTSEELRTPVAVLVDSGDLKKEVKIRREKAEIPVLKYERDVYQRLLCPLLAPYQQRLLEARLARKTIEGEKPRLPRVPDQLPPKFQAVARQYAPVFDAFKRIKGEDAVVTGDAGSSALFAFPPYDCVDVTTYYGGSIPLAVGFYLSGKSNVWAVTGDYAFIAAGNMGLIEVFQRRIPVKVLIFHNGAAAATGGQPIGPNVFESAIGGYRDHVRYIRDAGDQRNVEKVLSGAKNSRRLEIVVVETK